MQISLLEECGLLDRALQEIRKKEAKIVSLFNLLCHLNLMYIAESSEIFLKKIAFSRWKSAGNESFHVLGTQGNCLFLLIIFQVDKLSFKEQMASILLKLGHLEEAEKLFRSLLVMNADNYQ